MNVQLADELLRRMAAAMRSVQLYSRAHPIVARNFQSLSATLEHVHGLAPTVVIGLVDGEVIVDDTPIARADSLGPLVSRLQRSGIERITIDRGVTGDEIAAFVDAATALEPVDAETPPPPLPVLPHIRVGRITIKPRVDGSLTDMAAIKRLYGDAVSVASTLWESATIEGKPDATAARAMTDGLAQAVAENRTALVALTTLKEYDNYTFTHMVNVSVLTMAQAHSLGVDGPLLREFGLAGLMHDIGKVRTPIEILNKPDALSDSEFAIMKRHTVEGAEILRRTPDIPTLAPVVAFEHHLRLDGSGYPDRVSRASLNLGTMLCSLSDVYDAMRSQRLYQKSFPSERILAVLKRRDGKQFDRHLVRRFVQLVGIYPVGALVRLNTGEIAVVLKIYAPDPHRTQVRVVYDRSGQKLGLTYDVNLWESTDPERPASIVGPLDPADYQLDPLTLI